MNGYQTTKETGCHFSEDGHRTLVFTRAPLHLLGPGLKLSHAVYGEGDIKLISAGIPITVSMLQALRVRGNEWVMIEESDHAKLTANSPDSALAVRALACERCETPLPLKLDEEALTTWVCRKCHTSYHGHLDAQAAQLFLDNVLIRRFMIDQSRLQPLQESVAQAVHDLVAVPYGGPERRASVRMALTIPVAVVPVDETYEPEGPPFTLMTRNISTNGIAVVHEKPIRSKYLIVELPVNGSRLSTQLVVQVLRCRPIGSVYEIAGKFVMKTE